MSAFEDRMRKIAETMTPEAKNVVRQVLVSEHKFRFGRREELPETFATWALKSAHEVGSDEE